MNIAEKELMSCTYRATVADIETFNQKTLLKVIEVARKLKLPYMRLVRILNSMCSTHVVEAQNILPTVGRTAIMDHLTNASPSPSSLRINKVALGTGTTTPANADTTLDTETYRNNVASQTKSNNIGYVTGFFSATETSGTFKEVGLFINGSAGADTGTLFSHATIDTTKTTLQTLTIDYTITAS